MSTNNYVKFKENMRLESTQFDKSIMKIFKKNVAKLRIITCFVSIDCKRSNTLDDQIPALGTFLEHHLPLLHDPLGDKILMEQKALKLKYEKKMKRN